MINWMKRLLAGPELDELERWRIYWHDTRRWLAEFPDAADALDHLRACAKGTDDLGHGIIDLSQRMRTRRNPQSSAEADAGMLTILNAAMQDTSGKGVMFCSIEPDCRRCEKELRAEGFMPAMRMIVCPECGNKRCPKASDHQLACTGSNEPGQPGSIY